MSAIDRSEALEIALGIPGWMRDAELRGLIEWARGLPPRATWIEIGTHVGRSFAAVALSLPRQSRLVAIDHTLGNARIPDANGSVRTFFDTLRRIARIRPDLTIDCRRQLAQNALLDLGGTVADAVFIDGGHDFKTATQLIRGYRSLLRGGGLLAGHDYNPEAWRDVCRAVNIEVPTARIGPGSIWSQIV